MGNGTVTATVRLTNGQHRRPLSTYVSQLSTGAFLFVGLVLDPEL
jgi:hypothetical protein